MTWPYVIELLLHLQQKAPQNFPTASCGRRIGAEEDSMERGWIDTVMLLGLDVDAAGW